jgi:hypothetical protein
MTRSSRRQAGLGFGYFLRVALLFATGFVVLELFEIGLSAAGFSSPGRAFAADPTARIGITGQVEAGSRKWATSAAHPAQERFVTAAAALDTDESSTDSTSLGHPFGSAVLLRLRGGGSISGNRDRLIRWSRCPT